MRYTLCDGTSLAVFSWQQAAARFHTVARCWSDRRGYGRAPGSARDESVPDSAAGFQSEENRVHYFQGFNINFNFKADVKSVAFRVTSVNACTSAVAASNASMAWMGRPAASQRVTT